MELLVAMAILLIIIFVLLQVISTMASIWVNSTGKVSNFQAARSAFTVINRQLSRATLETYLDYINNPNYSTNNPPFGQFRSNLSASAQQTFSPYGFARASDLHFISGPASVILPNPNSTPTANIPGDAVFFQAPLGVDAVANQSSDKYLRRSLNDVGFYIQYSDLVSSAFPAWLTTFFGGVTHYGFRLVECIEPTENISVYGYAASGSYSPVNWLPPTSPTIFPVPWTTSTQASPNYYNNESVLAEDVVLLIVRPRLDLQDEQVLAANLGVSYSSTTKNSIISPNYGYDSRAWQTGYTFSSTSNVKSTMYALYMRNQLPPIVDVAMVCVDPNSLVHLQISVKSSPPSLLQPASGLFTNSANMDVDLVSFGQQLTANHLHYQIFRSSVQMQAAAWANE